MKDLRLVIKINKSASKVFSYTTDPKNTSSWIDTIVVEEVNEWPIKIGTIYRNQNKLGEWATYKVVSFEQDKEFILSQLTGDYHVRYRFTQLANDQSELEYYEWVDKGELSEPFAFENLLILKKILESEE